LLNSNVKKQKKLYKRSEDLLLNILPEEIAEELKQFGEVKAQFYEHVTVMFTDFENFTGISEQLSPQQLVKEIHQCFTAFDSIIERNGLEKIKTIGDAYLAVCGVPAIDAENALKTIKAAQEIRDYIYNHHQKGGLFKIRIGIHSGSVVAGIVGVKKFAYDIWGDTVNTAARMEQNGKEGMINISGSTYALIKNHYTCIYRGKIEAKHKGEIDMYFVTDENKSN
jgi:adenylate cyclase